ncbi:MAG: Gfo/Idh/MocA family oxidoreductase [Candidatus ainarchaeum sp.]|nr:Gfo/Idh/MocA family oxidoreductase [Candidatus ainarchaeum sp.]
MSNVPKIAVIGVGNMGKNHARIYFERPDVELVAICDSNKKKCDEFSEKYKCKAYYDLDEMLNNEQLDGVSICVPTMLHKAIVEKVAQKKINILLEKPAAPSVKEAEEIKDIIKKAGVTCVVGQIERYNPAVRKVIDLVFRGELGKIFYINILRQGPYPPGVVDVDVLTDLGIHDLEIINYLLGKMGDCVSYACLQTHNFINKKDPDIIRVLMKTKENIVINLSTDILSPTKIRKLYICGKKGLLSLDYITQEITFYENGKHKENIEYQQILTGVTVGEERKILVEKKEPLLMEIENFLSCIAGTEEPYVSIDDALNGIILLESLKKNFK